MLRFALKSIAHRDPNAFYKFWLKNQKKIKFYTYGSIIIGIVTGCIAYILDNIGGMQTVWASSVVALLIYLFASAFLRSYSSFPYVDSNGQRLSPDEVIENSNYGGERFEIFLLTPYLLILLSIVVLVISIFAK